MNEALTGVRFRLHADTDFDERTSFDAAGVGLRDIRPEFALTVDVCALEAARPLVPDDFALVIRLADPGLHRSEIVFERGVNALPHTWIVPSSVKDRFSWNFGFTASVALVLREDRPPKAGLPFLRGHWIARKDFSIRSRAERRTFPIERCTGDDFVRRGLPSDTVYWIDFLADDLNAQFNDPSEALRIYLRADVYDALFHAQESPSGRSVEKLILAEVLTEVLWRGLDNLAPDDEVERGGLLHSVLTKVSKMTGAGQERLCQLVNKRELATLRAYAQATVGVRTAIARLRVAG